MTGPVSLSPIPARFEDRTGVVRFGLLALATDLTSEGDLNAMLPATARLHTTRVAYENPTTPENLRRMAPRLTGAAELLVPGESLGAICYSCTSASVAIGDAEVTAAIQAARPGVPVSTPTAAARAALAAFAARRIAILTPYTIETSIPMAQYFAGSGFDVLRLHCLGIDDDRAMARVDAASIVAAADALDGPDAEALFISCTALPAASVVAEIERRTGKPVVTSNQASAWAMSRLAGFADHDPGGRGRLFSLAYPQVTEGAAA